MACCAFALFVLSQLLAPFVGPWRRLFGKAASTPNAVVGWSPSEAMAPAQSAPTRMRHARARRGLYVLVGVELFVAVAAFDALMPAAPAADEATWLLRDWCGTARSIVQGEG
jgi:hypothetical protein